jgi:hypothetical protein
MRCKPENQHYYYPEEDLTCCGKPMKLMVGATYECVVCRNLKFSKITHANNIKKLAERNKIVVKSKRVSSVNLAKK